MVSNWKEEKSGQKLPIVHMQNLEQENENIFVKYLFGSCNQPKRENTLQLWKLRSD